MNIENGVPARVNFACIVACAVILRPTAARAKDIAISGATVYTAPDDAPLRDGTVIVRGGKIFAVGAAIPFRRRSRIGRSFLLVPERCHRINPASSPCRNPTGQRRDTQQYRRYADENRKIDHAFGNCVDGNHERK